MLVWGGLTEESPVTTTFFSDGGRYDPAADQWYPLPTNSAPAARAAHTAVWDGDYMILWGGYHLEDRGLVTVFHDDGARYELSRDRWLSLPAADAPSARRSHTAIWTGSAMIIWGGDNGTNLDTGAVFEGVTRAWTALPSCPANMARRDHTAVFDGVHLLIWGGRGHAGLLNSGLIYNPLVQTWQSITDAEAPSAREGQVTVWTGEHMLIWGGRNGNSYYKDTFGYAPPRTSYLYLKP
jgi:N-acetylneuraminic acid mutarotase